MLEVWLALIGVALSAFFSGSELAFITANPLQIEVWSNQKRRGTNHALHLLGDPNGFLVSVLIGTTLANVTATSFATIYLIRLGWSPALVLAVVSLVILLFGEVIPKTVSGEIPNRFLRVVAGPHRLMMFLLTPLSGPIKTINSYFEPEDPDQSGRGPGSARDRSDLRILFEGHQDASVLQKNEQELITQVLDLGETPVSKAMTPRTEIAAIPEDFSMTEAIHTFIDSGNSKLPVYRANMDNIIGVVYHYDLFKHPDDLASIIKEVVLVPDSNTTMDVLRQLQRAHRSIAIILDEYGGTAGLVTFEDLFEEIFGEFEDEFDAAAADIKRLPDGSLLIQGTAKLEDLETAEGIKVPAGDYETLAGYLTSTLGRIPFSGERLYLPMGQTIITKASPTHIEQVHLFINSGDQPQA